MITIFNSITWIDCTRVTCSVHIRWLQTLITKLAYILTGNWSITKLVLLVCICTLGELSLFLLGLEFVTLETVAEAAAVVLNVRWEEDSGGGG